MTGRHAKPYEGPDTLIGFSRHVLIEEGYYKVPDDLVINTRTKRKYGGEKGRTEVLLLQRRSPRLSDGTFIIGRWFVIEVCYRLKRRRQKATADKLTRGTHAAIDNHLLEVFG